MTPLDVVKLTPLMTRTSGSPHVVVGLIDGPVVMHHPDLAHDHLRTLSENRDAACTKVNSLTCVHGTFVAGILCAKRGAIAPAICPDCTVLVRPLFSETPAEHTQMPSAVPQELATAIHECMAAGARVINLSLALARPSSKGERALEEALDHAAKQKVIIIAAAGNQGTLGSTAITRHPWVISVMACDLNGRPLNESNLGSSIGRHGLRAPGAGITSLGATGQRLALGGTSVAVPFVTGAIALLWSEFPMATAVQLKLAITYATAMRRATVVPPLLDAEAAYQHLQTSSAKKR